MHSTAVATRSRNYVFTLNNYTEVEVQALKESMELHKYIFLCWGIEVGESGTPHLQGYVENKNARTILAMKKDKGFARAHFEERLGTKVEATTYALKEALREVYYAMLVEQSKANAEENDTVFVPPPKPTLEESITWARNDNNHDYWTNHIKRTDFDGPCYFAGNWKHGLRPGTRTDINSARDIVKSGGGMKDVLNTVNSYQSARMAQLMLNYTRPTRAWKTFVIWLYGPTGTGKTEIPWAISNMLGIFPWISSNNLTWFDGYDRDQIAIIDDFRGDQSKLSWILRVLDKYPMQVPIKGAFCDWCPKILFITSCYSPQECYHNTSDENLDQLIRRVDLLIHTQKWKSEEVEDRNLELINEIIDHMGDIEIIPQWDL